MSQPNLQSAKRETLQYIEKLGLQDTKIDLSFVRLMQQKHMARFSFNSLAVLTGKTINIDTSSVFHKIVELELGGYCFEHNKLIYEILKDLSFDVSLQLARVVKGNDLDVPRTHRFTLLNWKNRQYIIDGGYGPTAPLYPIEFLPGKIQHQGNQQYRILHMENGDYMLQRWHKGEFQPLYSFDMARYCESDALTGHFYSHKHPSAVFVNNLVVSRKDELHIFSLRNHQFHIISSTDTNITTINDKETLKGILREYFSLDLDEADVVFLFENFVQPNLLFLDSES